MDTLHPPESLSSLRWHRLRAVFVNARSIPQRREHPISIINAIVKAATIRLDGSYDNENPHVVFHITDRRFSRTKCDLCPGDMVPVEVMIARRDARYADRWAEALRAYMADPRTEKNFALADISAPEERSLSALVGENPALPERGEICLEFITPLPTGRKKGRDRTFITAEDFVKLLVSRFSKLFGRDLQVPQGGGFSVLPYYWHYSEISHCAKSQSGFQLIKGCAGRLYIKGELGRIGPYLLIGSELHSGGKFPNSQGYYILHAVAPPFFAKSFPSRGGLLSAVRYVVERYDDALASLAGADASGFDEAAFVEKLLGELASGSYAPAPSIAFAVKKKDGTERLIERPAFRDIVVQRYLLTTVSGVFDRMFEETSIGFRNGVSRKAAIDIVRSAVADGHEHLIESDVAGFFPSVDWGVLRARLDDLLPSGDSLIKDLLLKAVSGGHVINGELRLRSKGLAQGNMLSPVLANLYLDIFDERMMARGARLVRYADDFVIMARTRVEAEGLLVACEEELSGLKLAVKREKTAIRHINDGFEFLGIVFAGGEVKVEPEEEFVRRLKKPLYVTEPFVMLALSDDAVEVRKGGAAIAVVPIRRISEVMVMEKAVFSTALIKRCAELKIPFSMVMNSGYCVATVRPDSKAHYDIAFRHAARFAALSDVARLAVAKEFAAGKLNNYSALFKQRHAGGADRLADELAGAAGRVYAAMDVNEVRGIEGAAAKKVYDGLNLLIADEAFHVIKRQRESPDRINSLLNFGYYLLFSRINVTLRTLGLNPYLGFLHSHADNYESLVCDVQELFRPRIDRLILRLIGLKTVTATDFSVTGRGHYLTREGAKKFIDQFEGEMERRSRRNALSMKDAIYAQALSIRAWALDEGTLTFHEWKP